MASKGRDSLGDSKTTGGMRLEGRLARFADLPVLESQADHAIPQAVADLIWSRKLLPVLTRGEKAVGPFGSKAPIIGAGDMSITYAVCPSQTGPSLHAHHHTYETFTVMRGDFEFSFGAEGEEKMLLSAFDVLSVPPGIYRAFRNVGNEEGVLQVIITGGQHDQADIFFPVRTAREILAHGEAQLAYFKKLGLRFDS